MRAARIIALGWASLWVGFELLESIGTADLMQPAIFFVLMFGGVAVAWRWPRAGGAILIGEGLVAIVLFTGMWLRRMSTLAMLVLFAAMCAPPIVAGVLFLRYAGTRPRPSGEARGAVR